ncbi:endo-1,4-beta-xylanase [Magnaporthiopsis poae ATCC 64411]|uniref:Endo-1,4-beta-xylanase n=1 Tax=Magnaporthiopsis poae (strain ATCC 64411 / 73-15) TaxID=644358 RepID=A0A0C4E9M5_MAGP6|nr:endo-1,4-beta-xylanase [Magnaporthiopsis poae ATCC 64411]
MRFSGLWAAALATLVHATADQSLDARSALKARAAAALDSVTVTNINDVRGNLHLPETWDGLPVRWTSSDPSVVGHDGLVKRREDGHRDVTLRATIEHEGVSVEREFTARVRQAVEKREAASYEGYAFSYFTGNSVAGEKIYFAASVGNDALNWRELNGGKPALASTMGTKGLRDPFLIRSPEGDTFYLIATDLSIGSGTSWGDAVRFGSLYLEVWESHDLVKWSAQRHIKVSPPSAGNTWAPEAYYDPSLGAYVGRTAVLYLDGAEVGRNTQVNLDPAHVGGGATNDNYIGKSTYTSDRLLKGQVRKFAVYNRALSAAEVLGKSGNLLQLTGVSLSDPSAIKASPLVSGSGRSVLFYVKPGTNLAALAPTFTTPQGLTVSPPSGTTVDFSNGQAVTYTLANNGTSASWVMTAHEMASPVLPGLYADPNIFIDNATYYIYATTDGFPGWGGKDFYVWSSPDMKQWTRTEKPILTLDGANGNVPWAVGNAWAPGFIKRNGKFYIYHSGHHIRLNTKTIGVAVASHPLGPFTAQPDAMIFNNETLRSNQAIDPAAFHDPVGGKYYLYWGNGRPLYAELADDMVSLVPGTTKQISGLVDFREGLFLVYRRGLYHLTYSIDDTGSEDYRVGYATATSPDGPWTYRGVVLAKRPELGILGTGHNSMAQIPGTDDWVIAYHRFGIPGGNGNNRETTIDRVEFDETTGLMKTIVPTLESVPAQRVTSVCHCNAMHNHGNQGHGCTCTAAIGGIRLSGLVLRIVPLSGAVSAVSVCIESRLPKGTIGGLSHHAYGGA